jgi:integrase
MILWEEFLVLFQKALDWGYLTVNQADSIKKFKEKKHKLRLTASILFKEIYPKATPSLKKAIMLAFHLVQHENEIKNLQWKHFDLEKHVVTFTRRKTDEDIVINYSQNAVLVAFLKLLKASRRDLSPYLISRHSKRGWVPYDHFRSMWLAALDKAGYKSGEFMFKEMRHLANTLMKDANITADKRMAMTGHKTILANEVYTHASGTDTIEAGKALSRYKPDEY